MKKQTNQLKELNGNIPGAKHLLLGSIDIIESGNESLSHRRLMPSEAKFLEDAAKVEVIAGNIRLREGEYQYDLAKTIASFQLELMFPDVKDLIRRLYGEGKTLDLQFVRKIQTILKKMEKSNVVRILPKKNPWQLQRYALASFKFQDSDKNLVSLATDDQMRQMNELLRVALTQRERGKRENVKAMAVMLLVVVSYAAVVWALLQPVINPIVFSPALFISVTCSLMLGKMLAERRL
jgi:hypothetical protein